MENVPTACSENSGFGGFWGLLGRPNGRCSERSRENKLNSIRPKGVKADSISSDQYQIVVFFKNRVPPRSRFYRHRPPTRPLKRVKKRLFLHLVRFWSLSSIARFLSGNLAKSSKRPLQFFLKRFYDFTIYFQTFLFFFPGYFLPTSQKGPKYPKTPVLASCGCLARVVGAITFSKNNQIQ